MYFIDPTIPTPTPAPNLSVLSDALDHSSEAVTSIAQLGVLGVFVLLLLVTFAAVVVIGMYVYFRRKSGTETQTIHAQILQSQQAELVEGRKERLSLEDRVNEVQNKLGERIVESNMAVSDALNSVRDLVKELKVNNQIAINQQNAVIAGMQEDIDNIMKEGTTPLKLMSGDVSKIDGNVDEIRAKVLEIHAIASQLLNDRIPCDEFEAVLEHNKLAIQAYIDEALRKVRIVDTAVDSGIQEEKHRSKPIPTIAPDENEDEEKAS